MSSLNNYVNVVTSTIDNTKENNNRSLYALDAFDWYDTSDIAIGDGYYSTLATDLNINAGATNVNFESLAAAVGYRHESNEIEFADLLVRLGYNRDDALCCLISNSTTISWKITCTRKELITYRANDKAYSNPITLNAGTTTLNVALNKGMNTLQYRRFDQNTYLMPKEKDAITLYIFCK